MGYLGDLKEYLKDEAYNVRNLIWPWVPTAYVLLALFGFGALSYFYYTKMQRPIAGVLTFIGGLLMIYFYYVKWFVLAEQVPAWPPVQTMCPDFLTAVPPPPGTDPSNAKIKCVDFVGVSKGGRVKLTTPKTIQTDIENPEYYFEVDPNESREATRDRVQERGLTWATLFPEIQ